MRSSTHVVNMAVVQPIGFSPHGEYLALSSPDGTLKIWDTESGTIRQEYTPSSHLSSTCSCLAWNPGRRTKDIGRKKKRRKTLDGSVGDGPDLIAMGTTSGSILLYSVVKGDLQAVWEEGHSDTVNGICWSEVRNLLYSCSRDQHVAKWDLSTGTVTEKWKADKGSVNAVCLSQNEQYLLSAGRGIKLWDLNTLTLIKTFTGHATPIFSLAMVPSTVESSDGPSFYFLSAAINDRLINAWHSSSSSEKTAVASFALPAEPVHLEVNYSFSSQAAEMVTVTKTGELLVFEHVLNGPLKKPLTPKSTIQVATDGHAKDTPQPIAILAAHLCCDSEHNLLYTHGNFLKLTFEKLKMKSLENNMCLIRKDPKKSAVQVEASVTKNRIPQVANDVTVLSPGHMAPTGPQRQESTEAKGKKKRRKSVKGEMTLDERLTAISMDEPAEASAGRLPPKAHTLATLLTQGLQSNDKKILQTVLQHSDNKIIHNTVSRLPVQIIVPFMRELTRCIGSHSQVGHTLVKWMRAMLTIHSSYLITFPELVDVLSSMYNMMESRTALYSRLIKLQGKLNLVLSQRTVEMDEEDLISTQQPLLVYRDDSSDEDIAADGDLIPDQSEDDWDEDMSDSAENGEEIADEESNDEEEDKKEMEDSDESMESDAGQ